MTPVIVIHYHEIALKGGNRDWFERRLVENIRRILPASLRARVARISGRLVIRGDERIHERDVRERLQRVFGIANIGIGYEVRQERDVLAADAVDVLRNHLTHFSATTFAVRAKRSSREYPETSGDIERRVGDALRVATGLRVDLDHPDVCVAVEIVERTAFVTIEKLPGAGGLPSGVSGRAVVLLSSGFDSPVAAWRVAKRGVEVIGMHFHGYPYTSDASLQNVRAIAGVLAEWQGPMVLVTIPLIEYQKLIMLHAPHAFRVLLYRRAMVRVAECVAASEEAGALVTGESIGQVASQTIANIAAIERVSTLPILRPLIGSDKIEIIAEADRIGTGVISRRPYDDCCSLFTPEHPATAARHETLERVELDIGAHEWTQKLFDLREREVITSSWESQHQLCGKGA